MTPVAAPKSISVTVPIAVVPAERRGLPRWAIIIGVIVGGILLALIILALTGRGPLAAAGQNTDNAYVKGRVTVVSPQVSGYVTAVEVQDYQQVAAGQVLVRIDDSLYRAKVEQAKAQLDAQLATLANSLQSERSRDAAVLSQGAGSESARAQLLRAQADMRRVDDLVKDGSVSRREADQTLAALRQAQAAVSEADASRTIAGEDLRSVTVGRAGLRANVAAARAALAQAMIDLGHTEIRAPEAGSLNEIGVRAGQYVTNGTQLLFLVPPARWIIANYKEDQTAGMAAGQRASFTVDALGGRAFRGHVERLAPAAGSEFSVIRPDNATGNFTKIAQRIGVRITIDPGQQFADRLRPGMSVTTRIDTGAAVQ